jgi:phospho-N-acetylmuramoyl-pentapeptide-transferase
MLWYAFWIAFIASGIAAKPILSLLIRWKSRQSVSAHAPEGHQKKQGTPTMGGLILVVGFVAAMAVFLLSSPGLLLVPEAWRVPTPTGSEATGELSAILILFAGFAIIGFVDDFVVPRVFSGKRGLGWKQKILLQIVVSAVAAGVVHNAALTWPFGVTVFLILFFSNAYNFADGLDGLAGLLLLAMVPGIIGVSRQDPFIVVVGAALAGCVIPFLWLNAPPAKVFMGDVGSLPVGAVLGMLAARVVHMDAQPVGGWVDSQALTTLYVAPPFTILSAALLLWSGVMIAELVPVPLQIFWVKVFKRRLFPFTPIHHAFEKAGVPETRVVFAFALVQLLLSAGAITVVEWSVRR